MVAFDDSFFAEVGLIQLPPDVKRDLENAVLEELQLRVGKKVVGQLTDAQWGEFEKLQATEGSAAVKEWLDEHVPGASEMVDATFAELKKEIAVRSGEILSTVSGHRLAGPTVAEIWDLKQSGRLIDAIKLLRQSRPLLSLVEAKDLVDSMTGPYLDVAD